MPEVRPTRTEREIDAALALRERVFVGEQGVPVAADRDGLDPESIHLVALEAGEVIATCRLLPAPGVLKLGRMAVAPEDRRRGLGAALLAAAEDVAREQGVARIVLHAQTYAEPLYAGAGYMRVGHVFLEEEIEHVRMELAVA